MSLLTGKKKVESRINNYVDNDDNKSEPRRPYAKFSKVKELQTLTNKYNEKNAKLLMREDELKAAIRDKERQIEEYRERVRLNKFNADTKTPAAVNRELRTKENLLQKKVVKYSTVNSENNAIMEKINALRKEKDVFHDIEKKLQTQLEDQAQDLNRKVERFQEYRGTNRSLQYDVTEFKAKKEQDHQNFNRGFQTMHHALRKENLKSTFQVRQSQTALKKNRGVFGSTGHDFSDSMVGFNKTGGLTAGTGYGNENMRNMPIGKTGKAGKPNVDTEEEDNKSKKLEEYKRIITSLKELMGENTFEGIQRKYEEMDDENYGLYNEVRGLIDDVDNLKEQKENLLIDIKIHEESKKKNRTQRDDAAEFFERSQEEVKAKIEFYLQKRNSLKEVINSIKIGIPIIFERIGCSMTLKEEIETLKLNDENIVNYLEQIENKTNEILKLYEKYQQREAMDNMTIEKEIDPEKKYKLQIDETEEINGNVDGVINDANIRRQMDDKLTAGDNLNDWRKYMKGLVEKKVQKYGGKKGTGKKSMQAEAVRKFAQLGRNIICIGRNYVAHAKELNNEVPKQPMWFLKPTSSYVQMPKPIIRPTTCQDFQYEVELGVIIGKGGKRIPIDQAMSHVGGYTLGIDMTCRDLQEIAKEKRLPWAESKGYDTFSAVGDFIDASKVTDPHNLSIWLKRNGDIKQDGNTKDMIFNIPTLISYLSRVMTLQPGDLILTGTPEGVGPVVPGDVVTCGIKELNLELSFAIVQEEI